MVPLILPMTKEVATEQGLKAIRDLRGTAGQVTALDFEFGECLHTKRGPDRNS